MSSILMRRCLCLCMCFYAVFAIASDDEEVSDLPKDMTFSYVNHPTMKNRLIPIIRDAYRRMGIKTHFVPQPSHRNLKLVETGQVDGDVGYMKIVLSQYQHLMVVDPPLVNGIFVLLCRKDTLCNESVLFDNKQTVLSTSATFEGAQKGFEQTFSAQPYMINDISIIPNFILTKKVAYALYATSAQEMWRLNHDDMTYVRLFDASVFHVLNNKYRRHQHLISEHLIEAVSNFERR